MTTPDEATLNTEQMAALLDMSPQRLRELTRRGAIPKAGHGRYLVSATVPAYCRNLREQAAGRAAAGESLDLVQERAALAKAQREKLEREAAQAARELVPASEVRSSWFQHTRTARNALLALPAQLSPHLAQRPTAEVFSLLQEHLLRVLEELATEPTTGAAESP